ncbi:MAG: NAD(P)-binding domain-containing protein [Deltaproteobacteria bacterium]|nr:NAD(P)-binding domain-containing protein [Deltaproteobacteria bacterium]
MKTVGMVGVGDMGTPMAKNLIKAGYPLYVYDIDQSKTDRLAPAGAKKAADARDLAAQCDVVLTVLTWPNVVEAAVLGDGGVLSGMKKGAILVECSSIDPETSKRIGAKVEAAGCRYVETALMGQPFDVESREIFFLSAGDKATVQECEPLYLALGRKNLYSGGVGSAKFLKITDAMCNATETMIMDEALTWSVDNQVAPEAFLALVKESRPRRASNLERLIKGTGFNTRPSWTAKDVHHGFEIGEKKEIYTPLLKTVNSVIELAQSQNKEGYSFGGMMYKHYESNRKKA